MARSNSSESPQEPTIAIAASRRPPPPCWSNDETVALMDAYRDKWYSLRRGNLRAPHWQEVADGVADRCPLSDPPKTSTQCRHKMEKLRKRYRSEIQRIGSILRENRYASSWVHFKRMDSMELGLPSLDPSVDPINQDEEEEDDVPDDEDQSDLLLYPKGIKKAIAIPLNRRHQGSITDRVQGIGAGNGNGVRIKIPNIAAVPPPSSAVNLYINRSFDDSPPPMNPRYGSGRGSKDAYGIGKDRNGNGGGGGMKRREEERENNGSNLMDEMVAAVHKLGDGFEKMERMKMDMARELESMRMNMEMKRTEMILESQQKLVDSFSKTVLEKKNKKIKRMPTPES